MPAWRLNGLRVAGHQYNADAEGIFIVRAVDVRPLLAVGWTKINLEISNVG
jgi:hypothetical protein